MPSDTPGDRKFIQGAIKRPGALTRRAKRKGRSVQEEAKKGSKSGTKLQKEQSNFFLNVLKPASKKRAKGRSLLNK